MHLKVGWVATRNAAVPSLTAQAVQSHVLRRIRRSKGAPILISYEYRLLGNAEIE